MDPVSAMATASAAFGALKKGFAIGRDIEQMSGDIGRWMSAVSDVDNAEKRAKNPPLFKKLLYANSIEQAAIEAFAAKKKLEEQRYELKTFLNMTYGPQAYNELLQMEGQIRKERKKAIYERQKLQEQIISWIAITILCATVIGFLIMIAILIKNKYA